MATKKGRVGRVLPVVLGGALGGGLWWAVNGVIERGNTIERETTVAERELDSWLVEFGASVQVGKLASGQCITVKGLPTRPLSEWHENALRPGAGHEGPDGKDIYRHSGGNRADVRDPRVGYDERVRLGIGGVGLSSGAVDVRVCGLGAGDSVTIIFPKGVSDEATLIVAPEPIPASPASR